MSVPLIHEDDVEGLHPPGRKPHVGMRYIRQGEGRVLVDGEVSPVRAGTIVLFPQGKIHMPHDKGTTEMIFRIEKGNWRRGGDSNPR